MYKPNREELCKLLDTPIFRKISETADSLGMECYVVGGYVRDIFLQRPSTDIDVVVVGKGIEMARAFSKRLGRKAHLAVYAKHGISLVLTGHAHGGQWRLFGRGVSGTLRCSSITRSSRCSYYS